jgi:hypothetical protein
VFQLGVHRCGGFYAQQDDRDGIGSRADCRIGTGTDGTAQLDQSDTQPE